MNSPPPRPTGQDDVVELPAIDLDAEPPIAHAAPADGFAGSPGSHPRWLVVALVFIVGAVLGVYVAGLRADAQAHSTVSLQFGGYDIQTWAARPGEPIRASIQVLNTGTREVEIVDISVPGLADAELHPHDGAEDGGRRVPPGEWVTIPIVREANCTFVTDGPVDVGHLNTASVAITAGLDGRTTEVELSGPEPDTTTAMLADAVTMACGPAEDARFGLGLVVTVVGQPRDGRLPMQLAFHGNPATDGGELVAIRSPAPGFTVVADALPVRLDAQSETIVDITWAVDCATVGQFIGEDALTAEIVTPAGQTQEAAAWFGADVTFALGGLYASTCSEEGDSS